MPRVTLSDRRNIATDPVMFDERLRLQEHGFTLCEQRDDGGDECCNAEATYEHYNDLDDEMIPICAEHADEDCSPIRGERVMLKMPREDHTISISTTTDGAVTIVVKKKFADDTFIARFCEIQFGRLYKRVTDWTRPALPFSFETDVQSTWVPSKKTP